MIMRQDVANKLIWENARKEIILAYCGAPDRGDAASAYACRGRSAIVPQPTGHLPCPYPTKKQDSPMNSRSMELEGTSCGERGIKEERKASNRLASTYSG